MMPPLSLPGVPVHNSTGERALKLMIAFEPSADGGIDRCSRHSPGEREGGAAAPWYTWTGTPPLMHLVENSESLSGVYACI